MDKKKQNIVHIATHGFYYKNDDNRKMQKAGLDFLTNNRDSLIKDDQEISLMRSGLLFSGCSNRLQGISIPEGVDDGILLAKEIASLDLRGLELVTLSACETGLGDITSEGVFGLQRAFKKAGAKSILMSLWKVDDNATRMFMDEFYRNFVSLKKSKIESLHAAQNFVRNYEDTMTHSKIYDNPKYWAAFILLDAI